MELVGAWSHGSTSDSTGYVRVLVLLLQLGRLECVLSSLMPQPTMEEAEAALFWEAGGVAEGFMVKKFEDLDHQPDIHRRVPVLDQGSTERGPSQWATFVFYLPSLGVGDYCGSNQS
ncbi:hypothetical protein BS78_04G088600 [Paspalum vaginatum]|nr:hypothetical protein BS78_04G088600 [Paspalum vaginatum]